MSLLCMKMSILNKKKKKHFDMLSAYEMFSWYKYLIVSLFFSHLGFWSGSLFLIAPFPDLCLLVLFFLFRVYLRISMH